MSATENQTPSPDQPASVMAEMWERTQKFKAANPLFAKYIELWNERATQRSAIRAKQNIVENLSRELDEIREKLSPEEREVL
jgi:cytochrome c556